MRTWIFALLALGCTGGSTPDDPTDGTDPTDPTDPGTLEDGQAYRLTIVMNMIWDEGNITKNYEGTADFSYLEDANHDGPCHDWLVGTIDPDTGEPDPGPHQCLGELLGDGHVDMLGSGDHTTFEGSWDPLVTGYYLLNSDSSQGELHVLLSGPLHESLTYCGPDGCNTITTDPYTEKALVLPDQSSYEHREDTPFPGGTAHEIWHLSRF